MTGSVDQTSLLPQPAHVQRLGGSDLPDGVALAPAFAAVTTARLQRAVRRLTATRAAPGGTVPLSIRCATAGAPEPSTDDDERYTLEIRGTGVTITAACEWGVLHALSTLAQLLDGPGPVAAQRIDDGPRFPWRGVMLDVARHFIPLADLLRTLDAMAAFRLNVLHLHLSDDQAFRYPSQCFPALRSEAHYTSAELALLVQRAADRGIRVVPELDVPGHTASWLRAYPDWGNRPAQPSRRFGVHRECLDPTRPAVLSAVAALFTELAETFPDRYVHFGGDEVHPDWWSGDAGIGAFMRRHGLAGPGDLQSYFNRHVVAVLTELGRVPIGWDEVLHPDLPGEVAVQAWRGATARDRALAAGHDCVVSAPYYLDLFYPADVYYGFDPSAPQDELLAQEDALLEDPRLAHVAAGMAWTRQWRETVPAPDRRRHAGRLLGAEACLWSELVDASVLDVRLWSRMPALAERFWSPADCRDVVDLQRRLSLALARLPERAGVDVAGDVRRLLDAAGLEPGWQPLVDMLEPVKWYGRLLGEEALAARLRGREMPQSRPYDADTPLNRVIDALPPESVAARDLAGTLAAEAAGDAVAQERLRTLARTWRDLPRAAGPADLADAAAELAAVGAVLLAVLDGTAVPGTARRRLEQAGRPLGEYLLAPVPALLDWLDRRGTGGAADG